MQRNFLDYYNKELTFMREMSHEFAIQHPKIAKRLGMHGIEVADPFVERLIEAFCFMSARTQLKLDAEFPLFTRRLLDIIYPNYTAPTPSMGVVQIQPSLKEGDFSHGYCVPRNSTFLTPIAPGEVTRCEFRSGQDVQLWPFEVVEAHLTSLPPDMPSLDHHRISAHRLKEALRIKLKLPAGITFSQLEGFDRLPIYINGDERVVSHIFELLYSNCVATIIRGQQGGQTCNTIISHDALSFDSLTPEQSLLPVAWNMFHGHNLVHEYFSCRQRFYFFTVTQLSAAAKNNDSDEMEIIILLDRQSQALATHVTPSLFLLHCTPVINLLPRRMDKLEINRKFNEFHVLPDRSRPLDFEIYSIQRVFGQKVETSQEINFHPLFQAQHNDKDSHGRYFSTVRKMHRGKRNTRKYDTRTAYAGTEVFLSLVDQQNAPYSDDIRYLSIQALVTNRDLPRLITAENNFSLMMTESAPVSGARFLFQPSAPRPPFADGESAWRLIRQLSYNYLPLSDMPHSEGGEAMRNMLRLFVSSADHEANTQIDALVGCKSEPVIRRLPGNGLLVYGRGIRCSLTVDEEGFSGISPYLFGMIMENYLARHAAINVFTETELLTLQRGRIGLWQPRHGRRGVL